MKLFIICIIMHGHKEPDFRSNQPCKSEKAKINAVRCPHAAGLCAILSALTYQMGKWILTNNKLTSKFDFQKEKRSFIFCKKYPRNNISSTIPAINTTFSHCIKVSEGEKAILPKNNTCIRTL